MVEKEERRVIRQGVDAWNQWRSTNPDTRPDLGGVDLTEADLSGADLSGADLTRAYLTETKLTEADVTKAKLTEASLTEANLCGADLSGADLTGAYLSGADLTKARLRGAILHRAILHGADLTGADLTGADLTWADLTEAKLVETTIEEAELSSATVYGVSFSNLKSTPKSQADLVITRHDEPAVTVDGLEVAQFMYLMLHNEKLRPVIDTTITSKVVLILGCFTKERKEVLDALRDELRKHNRNPVVFDFGKPSSKDVMGTVETLARMARYVIADFSDPHSIPAELATIVPFLRTTPVVLLRETGTPDYSMVQHLESYSGWVVPVREYPNGDALIASINDYVIEPAETRRKALMPSDA